MAAAAARVDVEVKGAERRLAGQDLKLSGTIRVTTTDTLYAGLLSPILAGFRQQFPDIELELVISNQLHSLSRREADVAIRPTRKPPETLVGRRVGDIIQAVYGQAEQWRAATFPLPPDALSGAQWIGPDPYMGDVALENWMAVSNRRSNTHYRLDSILAIQQAVRDGAGVAALPCYLAEGDDRLLRLTTPIRELTTELWLLTHPDFRRVARMRQFMDYVATAARDGWFAHSA
ncbi:substrate-binding domain-containing protein [Marinobacter sp.]|uniref:substrate-binding domain-containing protein n=1 Tax=Marinobacter sp. TaxID=50741 RepID=UPI00356216F6